MIKTPVVLFVYKRPKKTKQILNQINRANVERLFIVGDGPKKVSDQPKCEKVKDLILDNKFDFEVVSTFSDNNLGLKERFSTGLDWVFNTVDRAIILEDDTYPSIKFFHFCECLLEHYDGDKRVWDITGTNHFNKWNNNPYDYHFSYQGSSWGWATWRESWIKYDKDMNLWGNKNVRIALENVLCEEGLYEYAKRVYSKTYFGEIDTWDYQWGFARQINNGLSVVPKVNLIDNIGIDDASTHGMKDNPLIPTEVYDIELPLKHPPYISPDRKYDKKVHNNRHKSMIYKIFNKIESYLS